MKKIFIINNNCIRIDDTYYRFDTPSYNYKILRIEVGCCGNTISLKCCNAFDKGGKYKTELVKISKDEAFNLLYNSVRNGGYMRDLSLHYRLVFEVDGQVMEYEDVTLCSEENL